MVIITRQDGMTLLGLKAKCMTRPITYDKEHKNFEWLFSMELVESYRVDCIKLYMCGPTKHKWHFYIDSRPVGFMPLT